MSRKQDTPETLLVRQVHCLAGPDGVIPPGTEYRLPRAIAERYFDHGIAEIIDPAWEPREPRGDDEGRASAGRG